MKNKLANALITNQVGRRYLLQLFADGGEGSEGGGDDSGGAGDGEDPDEGGGDGNDGKDGEGPKTYTDAEVNAIVERKLAEWSKKKDKEVSEAKKEAEKLAKMNAEQKRQYEYEKLQQESADKDEEIATQDMLDFVVGDNAEETNKRIEKLVGIILDDRKAQNKARATGKTPKGTGGSGGKLSEIEKRIAKYQ